MRKENYEGLSDKDIIRRQRDKINGYKRQVELQIDSNKRLFELHSKLLTFMNENKLWHMYEKQRDELNGRT